jgi:galactose mutarotase-like enzyme
MDFALSYCGRNHWFSHWKYFAEKSHDAYRSNIHGYTIGPYINRFGNGISLIE